VELKGAAELSAPLFALAPADYYAATGALPALFAYVGAVVMEGERPREPQ
jgi:hypothetical protein